MISNLQNTRSIFVVTILITQLLKFTNAVQGCKPRGQGTEGFDMSLYHYDYYNTSAGPGFCVSSEYQSYDYMHGGYVTYAGGLFGTSSKITDLSLDFKLPELCTITYGTLPDNFNYRDGFTISNFTMLLTGYFYAETTGDYTFLLEADDLAYLSFGAGDAFGCCGMEQSVTDPDAFNLIAIGKNTGHRSGTVTISLNEGIYYPIRLLYINRDFYGVLSLKYTDPIGMLHSDFSDQIFQFPDSPGGCANEVHHGSSSAPSASSSKPSSSFSASSASSSASSDSSSVPSASSSATSASSRSSFSSSTLTSSNGTVSSGTSINPSESSYLSSTDEPITSNSSNESVDTYTSETSTVSATTTATVTGTTTVTTECTEGDVTAPTTYSTATVTVTGPDGIATTETTYYVKTPATPSGAATNKYSNGTATRYETVFSTIYSYCSCSDVSIYSTDVVTVTTTNGNGNPEKVVQTNHYVQVPETMTVNADMGSAVAAALASKTTEGLIPKYYPITTGLSTYSGAASGLSNGIFTFAVGLLFAMIVA